MCLIGVHTKILKAITNKINSNKTVRYILYFLLIALSTNIDTYFESENVENSSKNVDDS